ncbi:hypothetical protein GCM10028820_29470 [Tessaracoccus terricola]
MLEPAHPDREEGPEVVLLDADGVAQEDPPRSPSRGLLVAGIAGIVAGACITAAGFLLGGGDPEPLPVAWDTFPDEVLGLEREDLKPRAMGRQLEDRFDAYFEQQLANHRFAYGGDGAEVGYVDSNGAMAVRLSIVNGFLAPPLPWLPDAAQVPGDLGQRQVTVGDVRCAVETYYVSNGDSSEMQEVEAPNCVLNDEHSGIGLRLQGPIGSWEDPLHTPEDFAEALVAIHAALVR